MGSTIGYATNNWGVVGSEVGGRTAAVLYSIVETCKHLGIDPWAYLRDALPGIFALGEEPSAEQLRGWIPDRWLLNRTRDRPTTNTRRRNLREQKQYSNPLIPCNQRATRVHT
ncbi:transposase domain-containing protein [Gemmata massiliana]|uniref:transposase domain-containing protein n=1 Tax=Gemmata massiliana TaxID=1210884 RepID=UPI0013A6AA58|nr:transposase domain-containing protein [Gemmata massiliana]